MKCNRPCIYRGSNISASYGFSYGCDYIGMTHKSRVKIVYDQLGVKTMTEEAREMLKPENCPCFVQGSRGRTIPLEMPRAGRTAPAEEKETKS